MKILTHRISFSICCLLLFCSCNHENHIKTYLGFSLSKKKIDRFLEQKMAEKNIPGLAYAVHHQGAIVLNDVKGLADKEKGLPVSQQTIFEAASISKSVFAYFVMKIVEEGKLDLDKPLFEYLPYPDIAHDERYKKITARIVLSHRSGFPNWRKNHPDNQLSIQFDPGTDFLYSGEGYQYLAKVLKHIYQTNWQGLEDIFQEKVTRPLGMEHSLFIPNDHIREHKAKAYDQDGNWIDKSQIDWWKRHDTIFVAPTTLHTEPIDFAKWIDAILYKKGLPEARFDEMLQTHSIIQENFLLQDHYSLGFAKAILPIGTFHAHSGHNTGFASLFVTQLDQKWAMSVFNNSDGGGPLTYELALFLATGLHFNSLMALGILFGASLVLSITLLIAYFVKQTSLKKYSLRSIGFVWGVILFYLLAATQVELLNAEFGTGFFRVLFPGILIAGLFFFYQAFNAILKAWKGKTTSKPVLLQFLLSNLIIVGLVIFFFIKL